MQTDTFTKQDRLPSVQVLRAIAFMLIFLSHSFSRLGWWGAFGVSLFIVLSGYLETRKHLDDEISAIPFVKKKIKKVYPLHIITLLFSIPLSLGVLAERYGVAKLALQMLLDITMTQSWVPISSIYYSMNAVSWYLALVVFFALISPELIKWLNNSSVKSIKIIVLTLICCDFIVGYFSMSLPQSHWIAYVCPVTRSFDYMIGGGTYVLIHKKAKRWMLPTGLVIAMGVLIGSVSAGFSNEMFSSAFWIIPSVLIVPAVVERACPACFFWGGVKVGNISFELFLIHQLVLRYLNTILGHIGVTESLWRSIAVAVTAFAISVVAALMFRRLKRRFSERKLINESISK